MTFDEWISNPAGKQSAVMTNRQMYRDLYTSKFNKVMLREGNSFTYKCYKSKDSTHFVAHIKVPSEVIPKFYYDVVISFTPSKGVFLSNTSLKSYDVQFYTNSPDFVFTHCHAYVKNNLFFTELAKRMNKESIRDRAKVRNPYDMVGYVKSIYFAYLIMKSRNLLVKEAYTEDYNLKKLISEVRDADEVVADRQTAEQNLRIKAKRKENKQSQEASDTHRDKIFTSSKNIKKTPTVGLATTSKTSRKVKHTKKI